MLILLHCHEMALLEYLKIFQCVISRILATSCMEQTDVMHIWT